jgi:hypothetical protein
MRNFNEANHMAQETFVDSSNHSELQFHSGLQGKGGKAFFESDKNAVLTKAMAMKSKYILESEEDPEHALGFAFGPAFKAAAKDNGWTLVDCLNYTLGQIGAQRPISRPLDSPGRLASLLSKVGPNLTGGDALALLKDLIDGIGEDAALHLDQLKAKNGIDKDGFVLLRGKKEVK